MKYALVAALIGALAVSLTPNIVKAREGGIGGVEVGLKKKPGGQLALGRAFVPCGNPGGNSPNTVTEEGVPACMPPETFSQQAGNPPSGWRFEAGGGVQLKINSGDNKIVSPLDPAGSADLFLQLKLKGIDDATGPATSTGTLVLLVRETRHDRVNGDMTAIDRPFTFRVNVVGGKGKVKTSLNVLRNMSSATAQPAPFDMEIVTVQLLDGNGTIFAVPAIGL